MLADPPAVADPEQPSAAGPRRHAARARRPTPPDAAQAATGPTCAKCGAPMDPGQDWCLQCGAGAPGSLDAGGPSWRSAAAILTATAVLVLGAAAAAYAALNKEGAHKATPTVVAVATTPAAATPTPTTPVTPTPTTPGSGDAHAESLRNAGRRQPARSPPAPPNRRKSRSRPPRRNPRARPPRPRAPTKNRAPRPPRRRRANESAGEAATEPQPSAIVLDPDAATTYNPYGYPASEFGDPEPRDRRRHLDRMDRSGQPGRGPEDGGGARDRSEQRPAPVGDRARHLHPRDERAGVRRQDQQPAHLDHRPGVGSAEPYLVAKKRHERIKLQDSGKGFRFITLWISKAPAAQSAPPKRRTRERERTGTVPGEVAV